MSINPLLKIATLFMFIFTLGCGKDSAESGTEPDQRPGNTQTESQSQTDDETSGNNPNPGPNQPIFSPGPSTNSPTSASVETVDWNQVSGGSAPANLKSIDLTRFQVLRDGQNVSLTGILNQESKGKAIVHTLDATSGAICSSCLDGAETISAEISQRMGSDVAYVVVISSYGGNSNQMRLSVVKQRCPQAIVVEDVSASFRGLGDGQTPATAVLNHNGFGSILDLNRTPQSGPVLTALSQLP